MKRSPELRDLSEEHHYGLVAARSLRQASAGERPLAPTVAQFLRAWRKEIQPHFRVEEEQLLPGFAAVVPADDALIVQTLTDHVALRRAVHELQHAEGERQQVLAGEIGQALEAHIRFEERVLFPAVEERLGPARLAELGRALDEAMIPSRRSDADCAL
jgi:hemerythrin-like domain-containing protein